jgi:hypothetical protein
MLGNKQIILWISLLFAIVFGAAVKWFPLHAEQNRLQRLPVKGLFFSSQSLPLSQSEMSVFGQAPVIKRYYRFGRHSFVMIVVDGSANRHAVHDPLYCLQGDGWHIKSREAISVDGGQADLLRLSRNGLDREAVFWFSDGLSRHASMIRYWLQTTLRRLTFGLSDPEPVMVILQSTGNEKPDWRSLLHQCDFLFEI